jgi:hypothetical protein
MHLQSVFETILGKLTSSSVVETGVVWRWAAVVSYDFIKMLHQRCPLALVITSHFAVASFFLRDVWYVGRWGKLAFDGIRFALGGQLAEFLVWAQKQIDTDNASLRFDSARVRAMTP